MACVGFEWDSAKAKRNLTKHGIRLADAIPVLEDGFALTIRDPFSEQEERWITLGREAFGRLLIGVYTRRGERIRLTSARRATARERQQYEERHET